MNTTTPKTFSIVEAFKFAWERFKNNWAVLVGMAAIMWLVPLIPAFLLFGIAPDNQGQAVAIVSVIGLLMVVLNMLIFRGALKLGLKVHDNQPTGIQEIWADTGKILSFLGTAILFGVILIVGLILLIIPGIIWGVKYSMSVLVAVDRGLSPKDALKKSAELTRGYFWPLLSFYAVVAIVNSFTSNQDFLYGVLFLLSFPLTLLAQVYVYRKLLQQADAKDMPMAAPPSAPVVGSPVA